MPKRKANDNEKIRRKIRKLEKRLVRRERRRHRRRSTSTESSLEDDGNTPPPICEDLPIGENPPPPGVSQEKPDHITDVIHQELDNDILSALGEPFISEKVYDVKIHGEIFRRVENILKEGIPKDIKEHLIKACPIPENTTLLEAPILNPELEGILSDPIKSRDKRLGERQNTLGTALGRILKVTNMMTNTDFDKLEAIKILSDASKLLSDLHFEHTDLRRKLIIPNLDKNLSQTVENIKRDKYLFGENFNNHIKTSNAMKKSALNVLKSKPKPKAAAPNRQGNFKGPQHFRTQQKVPRGSQHQRPAPFKVQNRRPPPTKMLFNNQRARYP